MEGRDAREGPAALGQPTTAVGAATHDAGPPEALQVLWQKSRNDGAQALSFDVRRQASPTSIGSALSATLRASMRSPSSDQGQYTVSDMMATPAPFATVLRTASTEEVRKTMYGPDRDRLRA